MNEKKKLRENCINLTSLYQLKRRAPKKKAGYKNSQFHLIISVESFQLMKTDAKTAATIRVSYQKRVNSNKTFSASGRA